MFWTIDRFEEDFAVLMDDNGVCRSVPRDRLPEQVRQGDVLTEKLADISRIPGRRKDGASATSVCSSCFAANKKRKQRQKLIFCRCFSKKRLRTAGQGPPL